MHKYAHVTAEAYMEHLLLSLLRVLSFCEAHLCEFEGLKIGCSAALTSVGRQVEEPLVVLPESHLD